MVENRETNGRLESHINRESHSGHLTKAADMEARLKAVERECWNLMRDKNH